MFQEEAGQCEARELSKSIAPTQELEAQRGCIISWNKGKGKIEG